VPETVVGVISPRFRLESLVRVLGSFVLFTSNEEVLDILIKKSQQRTGLKNSNVKQKTLPVTKANSV